MNIIKICVLWHMVHFLQRLSNSQRFVTCFCVSVSALWKHRRCMRQSMDLRISYIYSQFETIERMSQITQWHVGTLINNHWLCCHAGDVPEGKIHYCERFLELMIDLEAQLPTRRFFNTVMDDAHLVVRANLSALRQREDGKLFAQVHVQQLITWDVQLIFLIILFFTGMWDKNEIFILM